MPEKKNDSKPWYLSRMLWVSSALVAINLVFLLGTFANPVYETAGSVLPVTPFPVAYLLGLDVLLGAALICLRHVTNKPIA